MSKLPVSLNNKAILKLFVLQEKHKYKNKSEALAKLLDKLVSDEEAEAFLEIKNQQKQEQYQILVNSPSTSFLLES